MSSHSIRWRLQGWLGLLLLILLTGFGLSIYHLEKNSRIHAFDAALESRVSAISISMRGGKDHFNDNEPPERFHGDRDFDRIPPEFDDREFRPRGGPPPDEPEMQEQEINLPDESDGTYHQVWRHGRPQNSATSMLGKIPMPVRNTRDTTLKVRSRGAFREAWHFTERGDCVLVGRSSESLTIALQRSAILIFCAGAAIFILGIAGGTWLTQQAIKPIDDISEAARRISAGNLTERIQTEGDHELGRLAMILNSTFARLEEAFNRQKQFTADASHELRTPITMMITEAQATLAQDRSPHEYREALVGCLEAAQQMRGITQALLQLARADNDDTSSHESFDMASCIEEIASVLAPRITAAELSIVLDTPPTTATGSIGRFSLVVSNLLENAVHYNKPGGTIQVSCRTTDNGAELIVKDTGLGISAEDLPHIFERFYRADKARSRSNGRFGLGLAICDGIVRADGGTISAESELGVGTTFTVTYPLPEQEA